MKFEIKYICITYILGILIGIYLNNYCLSIFFLLCIIWSFMFKNNKKISIVLIILLLSSTYTIFRFYVFNDIIKDADNCVIKGTIIGKEKETQYSIKYKFRVDSYDLFIYIPKNIIYDYGDEIVCKINIEKPLKNTNYGGFNNMMYLYSNNVIAIGYVEKVYSVEKGKGIYYGINRIKQALIEKIDKEYSDDVGNVVKTLVLNDDSTISNEIKDAFYDIGIAHVLVPSSTHLMYILLFVSYIISILNIKNRYKGLINLAVVFVYLVITGFSISLIRVFLIYCVSLIYSFLFIKISRIDKVCLVLLILLIYNPMSIFNIGLLLSFGSVLGIQLFSRKIIYKLQYSINKNNNKIVSNILNILGISLAVQIAIMPIILCCFNKVYITGVLANVIAIPLSGIAIFLSLILFIFFNIPIISNLIIFISTVVIQILLFVLKYFSEFPMASINFFPMNVFEIAIYYFVIFDIFVTKKYLNLLKKIFFKKKVLVVLLILILIYNIYDYLRLEVSFVDVGQGDCMFIKTYGKNILIDGGGSNSDDFNVGERVILPYLLYKRVFMIDYIFITHFDSDHYNGLNEVISNLKVKNIVITKQFKITDEFIEFVEMAKTKGVNIIIVSSGDVVYINSNVYFYVIFPDNIYVPDSLNNNSLVMKFVYYNLSFLLTGDIEKEVEKYISDTYGNILKTNILKVSHHGSDTSSTEEFLHSINPNISVVSVGRKNGFGHPNMMVINRLKKYSNVFRTDVNGQIHISKLVNFKEVVDWCIK